MQTAKFKVMKAILRPRDCSFLQGVSQECAFTRLPNYGCASEGRGFIDWRSLTEQPICRWPGFADVPSSRCCDLL